MSKFSTHADLPLSVSGGHETRMSPKKYSCILLGHNRFKACRLPALAWNVSAFEGRTPSRA